MKRNILLFVVVAFASQGCGLKLIDDLQGLNINVPGSSPTVGKSDGTGVVVKSRALFQVSAGDLPSPSDGGVKALAASQNVNVSVTNAASTTMTVDTSGFIIPTITNQLLSFGYLQLSALQDNNLNVCGTGGNQKCGTALIRVYTTGTAGAGLYNTTDSFGAPIQAGISSYSTVGLNVAGAAVMQSISIPSSTHVLHLSDFPTPKYNVQADFTNAGAGAYSTTIVVEYALAP